MNLKSRTLPELAALLCHKLHTLPRGQGGHTNRHTADDIQTLTANRTGRVQNTDTSYHHFTTTGITTNSISISGPTTNMESKRSRIPP